MKPTVVVFGSLNMDLVARVQRLPSPGETLTGQQFETTPGGKGANQAVAAARLGAPTAMVGRVGADAFGEQLLASLASHGVATDAILRDTDAHTGVALINVAQNGDNAIVVVPGANGRVQSADVERLRPFLADAAILLVQLEVPHEAVLAALRLAREMGVRTILDPAPAQADLPDELLACCDILTPNEHEAAILVGGTITTAVEAAEAAETLRARGASVAIITRGEKGATVAVAEGVWHQPPFRASVVDTVGAGDAFDGALAALLADGQDLATAVRWAAAAGALAVQRHGAQAAMPTREEVLALVQSKRP